MVWVGAVGIVDTCGVATNGWLWSGSALCNSAGLTGGVGVQAAAFSITRGGTNVGSISGLALVIVVTFFVAVETLSLAGF